MTLMTRLALGVAALGLLLLASAGPSYRIGLLSIPNAFGLMRWAAYAGLAATVVALAAGGWAYYRKARTPVMLAAAAFIAGFFTFAIPFQWQRTAESVPRIHDVTTDLENPPQFQAILPLRADAPNSLERPDTLAAQQRSGYPDIAPITMPLPADQAFDRALAIAQDTGWEIVTADKGAGRIEATATTRWFGFKDDVVVRLTAWGSGTRVDVRSVSRVGGSDVGTNARRIRRFLSALQSA